MLKVGIIGCGKIADAHAAAIARIGNCDLVGACDREPLMAKQLAERFQIKQHFELVEEMVAKSQPDVVHITTPPASHFSIAKFCLERGCNVYVEKPFTLNTAEARQLIALAEEKKVKLTAGHNYQFTHAARRMRELVRSGYLGERLVHMESYYGYDLGDVAYARAFLEDQRHWVRGLPGQLLQNVISHGIARIAEFLTGDDPKLIVHGFTSPLLTSLGETEIVDELRVIISDENGTTAYFTFSAHMKPILQEFRIYGLKNSLILDQNHEVLIKLRGDKFKSYADFFIPPVLMAKQQLSNLRKNVSLFLKHDFHNDAGMKCLIEAFYRSIIDDSDVPISYREILLTSKIMDSIFDQVRASRMQSKALGVDEATNVQRRVPELIQTVQ